LICPCWLSSKEQTLYGYWKPVDRISGIERKQGQALDDCSALLILKELGPIRERNESNLYLEPDASRFEDHPRNHSRFLRLGASVICTVVEFLEWADANHLRATRN
jgi:hypothetical protein